MATNWQILDRVWDLPDRNKIKSDTLRKVLRELHTSSGKAGYEVLPGPVSMTQPLVVDEGRTVVVEGDLSIGTAGTPLTVDQTHLVVKEGGRLVVLGTLDVHRNVSSTTRLVSVESGEVEVTGAFTAVHAGGGANEGVSIGYGSAFDVGGATVITSDATGGWSAALYVWDGTECRFQGGLAVTATGASVNPVGIYFSEVVVGDGYMGTGDLVVTQTGSTANNYAVVFLGRAATAKVWGDTTITADSITTNQSGMLIRNDSLFHSAGAVTISMASNDCAGDAALLWVRRSTFNMSNGTKTFTATAGALASPAILMTEHGQISINGAFDARAAGVIKGIEQSELLLGAVGSVNFGTAANPITADLPALQLESEASCVVSGNLEVHRDVAATTALLDTKDGNFIVTGTLDATHEGGGNNVQWLLEDGADVVVDGLATLTTDATGAAAAALQGNTKADAAFKAGLTIVATGADVKPLNFSGDVDVVVGDTATAAGNLTITRSGSGNVWTQNPIAGGSKLTVAGNIVLTANAITANEVLFFLDAGDLVCSGDVTLNATSLADGAIQLYNGATFVNNHNIKTLSISLGTTAVQAIKVMRGSKFVMANDIILEGTAAAVMLDAGGEMEIGGDLLLGNTTPQPTDITCLSVLNGAELTVAGALTIKRDVAGAITSNLINVSGAGSSLDVGGAFVLTEDPSTSEITSLRVNDGCAVTFRGTTSFAPRSAGYAIHISGSVVNFVGHYALAHYGGGANKTGLRVDSDGEALFHGNFISNIWGTQDCEDGGHMYTESGGKIRVLNDTTVTLADSTYVPAIWAIGAGSVVEIAAGATLSIDVGLYDGGIGPQQVVAIKAESGGLINILCAIPTFDFASNKRGAIWALFGGKILVGGNIGGTSFSVRSTGAEPIWIADAGEFRVWGNITMSHTEGNKADIRIENKGVMELIWGTLSITGSPDLVGNQIEVVGYGQLLAWQIEIYEGTLAISEGSICKIGSGYSDGDLIVGDTGVELTEDVPCIEILRGSKLQVAGNTTSYRNVSAANPMILMSSDSEFLIGGDCDLSRAGVGAGGVIDMDASCTFKAGGTTDLLAHGGAIAGDGAFLKAGGLSKATFNQVLFATGANLDLGAFASVLMEQGSQLYVTDAAGASDALNSDGGANARGIKLKGGSQAHVPAWTANSGIGVSGAGSGYDAEVGGTAAADYTGSEIVVDAGAATPELCLLNKP